MKTWQPSKERIAELEAKVEEQRKIIEELKEQLEVANRRIGILDGKIRFLQSSTDPNRMFK